jgi:hypothetical protein
VLKKGEGTLKVLKKGEGNVTSPSIRSSTHNTCMDTWQEGGDVAGISLHGCNNGYAKTLPFSLCI